jgi:chitinase
VKVLKNSEGDDKEFLGEVTSIGRITHVSVVPLLGFCLQGPTRALIYEYMPNGSLESYAFSNNDYAEDNSLCLSCLTSVGISVRPTSMQRGSVQHLCVGTGQTGVCHRSDLCPLVRPVEVTG